VQRQRWFSGFIAPLIAAGLSVVLSPVAAADGAGLRPDSPPPTVGVNVQAPSPVNFIAEQAASDVEAFWTFTGLPGRYSPPAGYVALPAPLPDDVCLKQLQIARFCSSEIAWDVPEMEQINNAGGALAVADVLAHEMGHQIQTTLIAPISERGADCLSGVYLASVVNGTSPRFMGNVVDVRNSAAAAFAVGGAGPDVVDSRLAALDTGLGGTVDVCLAVYTD
jgi:hypothetical protein